MECIFFASFFSAPSSGMTDMVLWSEFIVFKLPVLSVLKLTRSLSFCGHLDCL